MSNRGVMAFLVTFAALAALTAIFVYPWIFGMISGVFNNADLGALVAIFCLFLITGGIIMVLAAISAFIAGVVN